MTITRADVADLQPGDVVELHRQGWAKDVVVRGTVLGDTCIGELYLGDYSLVSATGQAPVWLEFPDSTLTIVSRAPRPLYVNHDRTKPVPGDVVRDADDSASNRVWVKNVAGFSNEWLAVPGHVYVPREQLPARLRLLVDGESGQVVQ